MNKRELKLENRRDLVIKRELVRERDLVNKSHLKLNPGKKSTGSQIPGDKRER